MGLLFCSIPVYCCGVCVLFVRRWLMLARFTGHPPGDLWTTSKLHAPMALVPCNRQHVMCISITIGTVASGRWRGRHMLVESWGNCWRAFRLFRGSALCVYGVRSWLSGEIGCNVPSWGVGFYVLSGVFLTSEFPSFSSRLISCR